MILDHSGQIPDSAPGIFFVFDEDGRFAEWSQACLDTFGLRPEDLAEVRVLDRVAPDQVEVARQAIGTILGGASVTLELDLIVADGSRRSFYVAGERVVRDGRPYVSGVIVDFTERKRADRQLRRRHEILECVSRLLALYVDDHDADAVFDTALTDILRLTGSQYGFLAELGHQPDGAPFLRVLAISNVAWDAATQRCFGDLGAAGFVLDRMDGLATAAAVTRAPVIANDIATDPRSSKRMPAGHPPLTNFLGLPLIRGSETLGSIGLANRDGGYDQDLVDELHPVIGVCAQVIAAWRNRRARREAERELRERERELDCILENIPLMVCVKDAATGQFIRFNRAGEQLLSISREALIGRADYALLPKEQADFFASCDCQALAKGLPLDIPEQPLSSHEGVRTLHTRKVCVLDDVGEPRFLLGIAEDVSERKGYIDTLRLYERLVSALPDQLAVVGRDYRYVSVNDASVTRHGRPRDAIVGHSVAELLGRGRFETLVKDKLDRCLAGAMVHFREWFDFPKIGARFMDVTYTPYVDAGGRISGVIVAARDLTDLEQANKRLRESEMRFRLVVDQVADALYVHDQDGRLLEVNQRACDALGYPRDTLSGMNILDLEEDLKLENARAMWQSLRPGEQRTLVGRHRRKDGSTFPVETRVSCFDLQGQRLIVALARDIGQRLRAEEKLRQAAVVFHNAQEGIMITDEHARIQAVNQAFCDMTGYTEAEVLGQTPAKFKSGRHDPAFYQEMWQALTETGRWQGEVWDRRRTGESYPKWLSISAVAGADGKPGRYVALFADISRIKESEARLEHLAHFDPLTDLPNRLFFNSRLEHAIEQARRGRQRIALLFLDLDRFKTVNDSLGHPAGDQLLIAVAERIGHRLRAGDTLARLGGDEFVILLEQISDAAVAAVVAQDILKTFAEPVCVGGGHEVFIGCSIGISLFPDDADDGTRLVSSADAALYRAKEEGRNTYRFYTAALTAAANEHLALETKLRRGLECHEFLLHYQPLIDGLSGRVVGVEALMRLDVPGEAPLLPGRFIPIAEETGLIVPLGEWALRTACAQARAWMDAGMPPLTMAVNLSGRQFQSADVVAMVRGVLTDTGLPAHHLELELTESVIMKQAEQAPSTLTELKALGLHLAIDNFGTGYSSLAYLKRFPIDKLKIDRSFVDGLADDPNDREIAATIIAIARGLNLWVLAEGVETEEQLAFLRRHGCDQYQGDLFGKPGPADEVGRLLGQLR